MAVQGPIPVEFGHVFTHGAYAAGEFEPMRDFDASSGDRFVQAKDKATGLPVWVIEVIDGDPAARMGHDSERAAMIYQHESRGADQVIMDAIDRHVQAEQEDGDDEDGGAAGVLVPAG
jgi:hypothetical protein